MPSIKGVRYHFHLVLTVKTHSGSQPAPEPEEFAEEMGNITYLLGYPITAKAHLFEAMRCGGCGHEAVPSPVLPKPEPSPKPEPVSTEYMDLAKETAKLVYEKNAAYGDSFKKSGEVLRQLYPGGVKPEQYDDMLAIIRIVDKLFRIATGGGGEDAARDITGYGLLMQSRNARSVK